MQSGQWSQFVELNIPWWNGLERRGVAETSAVGRGLSGSHPPAAALAADAMTSRVGRRPWDARTRTADRLCPRTPAAHSPPVPVLTFSWPRKPCGRSAPDITDQAPARLTWDAATRDAIVTMGCGDARHASADVDLRRTSPPGSNSPVRSSTRTGRTTRGAPPARIPKPSAAARAAAADLRRRRNQHHPQRLSPAPPCGEEGSASSWAASCQPPASQRRGVAAARSRRSPRERGLVTTRLWEVWQSAVTGSP
ncbi:hypothetical protein B0E53_03365 [Micromonospora sp. MH33]|nr:hypothetical protein B0E53_03365 [Micromonospora sp. MH33]